MKLEILNAFDKDMNKLDAVNVVHISLVLIALSEAVSIQDVPNIKKMRGTTFAYRIRVGDYRIGFVLIDNDTVELHRVLHRSKIYHKFP
jgi:mRNA interferase RelE/StbE